MPVLGSSRTPGPVDETAARPVRPLREGERRLAGWSGLAVGTLSLVMVPLYFVYSGPPPATNVMTRNLCTVVICVCLAVFVVVLSAALRRARPDRAVAAEVVRAAGVGYAMLTLVSASLENGVAMQYPDGSMDPTVDGPLAAGIVLLHGPVARILLAVVGLGLASVLRGTRLLPRFVGVSAVVMAVANLAFVPSLYFGMDPAVFYAANGWGSTATISGLTLLWFGVLGATVLARRSLSTGRPERSV